jgi:hypothetical protein
VRVDPREKSRVIGRRRRGYHGRARQTSTGRPRRKLRSATTGLPRVK